MQIGGYKIWMGNSLSTDPSYIDQILPENAGEYCLISGKTGIGKSILALHLAFCLATGTPFMGFATEKVRVGYRAMEGGKSNWRDRFLKIEAQYPDATENLRFELEQPLDLVRHFDDFAIKFEGCQVVVLDNLRQVTTGKYLDMNYAASWLKVYQEFLAKVKAMGILTMHIRKPSIESLIEPGDVYELKGATEYVDASTTVLLLERQRQKNKGGRGKGFQPVDKNAVTLYFAKHRIASDELKPVELYRNYDKCSFDITDNPNLEFVFNLTKTQNEHYERNIINAGNASE